MNQTFSGVNFRTPDLVMPVLASPFAGILRNYDVLCPSGNYKPKIF